MNELLKREQASLLSAPLHSFLKGQTAPWAQARGPQSFLSGCRTVYSKSVDRSLCSSLKPMGHEWEQDRVGKGGPRAWVRTQNGPGEASESRSGEAEETCNALDMFGRDLSNP